MSIVRDSTVRTTTTPNATMTTFASPTLGATQNLSMWRVQMAADATGPLHAFDVEQIWHVESGALRLLIAGETSDLAPGDTACIPAGVVRQIRALTGSEATVCGIAATVVTMPGEPTDRGTPAWIA